MTERNAALAARISAQPTGTINKNRVLPKCIMLILSSHTHSQRKAVVVSTLAARRAGNKHAASAIAPNNDAVQRKVVSLILPRTFAGSTLFAHIIVKAPFSFS